MSEPVSHREASRPVAIRVDNATHDALRFLAQPGTRTIPNIVRDAAGDVHPRQDYE